MVRLQCTVRFKATNNGTIFPPAGTDSCYMFNRESFRENLNDPEIAVSKQLRKREASIPSK